MTIITTKESLNYTSFALDEDKKGNERSESLPCTDTASTKYDNVYPFQSSPHNVVTGFGIMLPA